MANRGGTKVQVSATVSVRWFRMPFGKTSPRAPELDGAPFGEGTQLVDRIASELDLLSRNVEILERLSDKNPLGIIRLSEALRLPIHKVRYSLHLLEREGVIQPSAEGAVLTEKARQFWTQLNESLDRMSSLVQQLKQKASAHQGKTPIGPKGY
jgi:predicted transcriptional regulator